MGEKVKAEEAMEKIIKHQNKDGSFSQAETSITRSSGKSLVIETSSLALLSMLRIDSVKYSSQIKKTVEFLISSMNGGYFGSTQATILALKALVEVMQKSNQSEVLKEFEVSWNSNKNLMLLGDQMKNPDKGNTINSF
jgi:aminopeptidase N